MTAPRKFGVTASSGSNGVAWLSERDLLEVIEAVRLSALMTVENESSPARLNRIGRDLAALVPTKWTDEGES